MYLKRNDVRDSIEKAVKEQNINRKNFHESSKLEYESIRRKFYYSFFDYDSTKDIDLTNIDYMYLRLHKRLKKSPTIFEHDWEKYIDNIAELASDNGKHYLILSHGWVYEGYIAEIISVLKNTEKIEDFYVVSKKFDWLIVHADDADCMFKCE